jgi:hypothetical protein
MMLSFTCILQAIVYNAALNFVSHWRLLYFHPVLLKAKNEVAGCATLLPYLIF